jgi:hypothetical protein
VLTTSLRRQAYFLVAVSNRLNLELCVRHALAGFSNSGTGAWAYVDICEGDYISFLYGARAFNLYRVEKKEAPPVRPLLAGILK